MSVFNTLLPAFDALLRAPFFFDTTTNRDHALSILVHMLGIFGQSWAIEDDEEKEEKKGEGSIGSCVSFFVHVLSAEVCKLLSISTPLPPLSLVRFTPLNLLPMYIPQARMASEELEALWGADEVLAAEPHLHQRIDRARKVLPLCLDGMDTVLRFLCGVDDDGGTYVILMCSSGYIVFW